MTGSKQQNAKRAPGRVIDLDQARAARAEVEKEPITVKFDGKEFALPAELPFEFATLTQAGQLREAFASLLGDEAEEFFALKPTLDDVRALSDAAAEMYGLAPGESPASPGS